MDNRQIGKNHRVGYRTPDRDLDPPDEPEMEDCPDCRGEGETKDSAGWVSYCETCDGTGRVIKKIVNIHDEGEY